MIYTKRAKGTVVTLQPLNVMYRHAACMNPEAPKVKRHFRIKDNCTIFILEFAKQVKKHCNTKIHLSLFNSNVDCALCAHGIIHCSTLLFTQLKLPL